MYFLRWSTSNAVHNWAVVLRNFRAYRRYCHRIRKLQCPYFSLNDSGDKMKDDWLGAYVMKNVKCFYTRTNIATIYVLEQLPLQWRHNECDGVSDHRRLDCLLNRLFRLKSKESSKLCVTGLCGGIHRWPVISPHKGPVARKMFPFDDVIMFNQNRQRFDFKLEPHEV